MNLKNARIHKLWERGLSVEQIAKKLGLNSTDRVEEGLHYLAATGRLARRLQSPVPNDSEPSSESDTL